MLRATDCPAHVTNPDRAGDPSRLHLFLSAPGEGCCPFIEFLAERRSDAGVPTDPIRAPRKASLLVPPASASASTARPNPADDQSRALLLRPTALPDSNSCNR